MPQLCHFKPRDYSLYKNRNFAIFLFVYIEMRALLALRVRLLHLSPYTHE